MHSVSTYWWFIWVTVAYLCLGVYTLNPDQVAAVYLFGNRWKIIGKGGWHFVPWLIAKAYVYSIHTHRTIAPGPKELIVIDDGDSLLPGQVRPIRNIHASKENAIFYRKPASPQDKWIQVHYNDLPQSEKEAMEDDGLSSSITTEAIVYVDWNLDKEGLVDESLFDFVETIKSLEVAGHRFINTVKSDLQDMLAPITARHAVEIKPHLEEIIRERLEVLVGQKVNPATGRKTPRPWGVYIAAVQIEEINPGRTVNKARALRAAAVDERIATVERAEGEKKAIELAADAAAYNEITVANAKAAAFEKMAAQMRTPEGKFAAQLEAAERSLKGSNHFVLPDLGGMIGSLSKVIEGVKSNVA